jgi:hypothetical protein
MQNSSVIVFLSLVLLVGCSETIVEADISPPFSGTIFIDPNIITDTDPSAYSSMTYAGRASRTMFDRRDGGGWITLDPYLFDTSFDDGLSIEIQVNPEFSTVEEAQNQAVFYADAVGRLPTSLRTDVETMWIHEGVFPFGGGNNNILIHIGQGEAYTRDSILEETLVHEAAHTSLDPLYASSTEWIQAQNTDPTFVSTYAQDFPMREDIAESFLPFLAVEYRSDRISASLKNQILEAIPNRIAFFRSLGLDMYPIN